MQRAVAKSLLVAPDLCRCYDPTQKIDGAAGRRTFILGARLFSPGASAHQAVDVSIGVAVGG